MNLRERYKEGIKNYFSKLSGKTTEIVLLSILFSLWLIGLDYYNIWTSYAVDFINENLIPIFALEIFILSVIVYIIIVQIKKGNNNKEELPFSKVSFADSLFFSLPIAIKLYFIAYFWHCIIFEILKNSCDLHALWWLLFIKNQRWLLLFTCFVCFIFAKVSIYFYKPKVKEEEKDTRPQESKLSYWLGEPKDENASNNFRIFDIELNKKDDDIFNRGYFVDLVENAIKRGFNDDSSFSIGINGAWGSGKSSIIKLIIKDLKNERIEKTDNRSEYSFQNKEEYVIIDSIDPWIVKNSEELVIEIYRSIINNCEMNSSLSLERINNIKTIIKILNDNSSNSVLSILGDCISNSLSDSLFTNNEDVLQNSKLKKIKESLKKCIKKSGKKLLFVFDNLDRADKEKIKLLFCSISCLFDLPNVVYVFLYDKSFISNLIDGNPRFYEKLINTEFQIPILTDDLKEQSYRIILDNIVLNKLHLPKEEQPAALVPYKCVFEYITSNVCSVREFIRLLNSSIPCTFYSNNRLYPPDYFAIQAIAIIHPNILDFLYRNKSQLLNSGITTIDFETNKVFFRKTEIDFPNLSYVTHNSRSTLLKLLCEIFPGKDYVVKNNAKRIGDEFFFDAYFQFTDTIGTKIFDDICNICENSNFIDVFELADIVTMHCDFNRYPDKWLDIWDSYSFTLLSETKKEYSILLLDLLIEYNEPHYNQNFKKIALKHYLNAFSKLIANREYDYLLNITRIWDTLDEAHLSLWGRLLLNNDLLENSRTDVNNKIFESYRKICEKYIFNNEINIFAREWCPYLSVNDLTVAFKNNPEQTCEYLISNLKGYNFVTFLEDVTYGNQYIPYTDFLLPIIFGKLKSELRNDKKWNYLTHSQSVGL